MHYILTRANLPPVTDGGSFADLPPVHPTSVNTLTSLPPGGPFNSATIGGTSGAATITASHLTRSRGSMGAADRPQSSTMSSMTSSSYGGHRRPLSLAEAPLISAPHTGSTSATATPSTPSTSFFRTLPSSKKKKNNRKVLKPPIQY
ncbi:unnamed protein product [Rodentolepis nana]|uniref:Protein-tyrosine-phosphatase n=1 Tax=Rodentolepis nana TaxID=102285 RepID=A0A0R3T8W9_RODNA|nr:unnamed protein product [Rodentolepis nana]